MHARLRAVLFIAGLTLISVLAGTIFAQDGERVELLQDYHVFLPAVFDDDSPPHYPPINKVVFASGYTYGSPRYDIYVMNPDGSGRTQLTFGSDASYSYPVWSPDGSEIAFTAIAPDGSGGFVNHIYVMNADGSGVRNLVNLPGHHFHPTWSPYGDQIAYSSDMHDPGADTPNDIYAISADGVGLPVNLTNTPDIHEASPAWSPDGTKIAYVSYFPPNFSVIEIFVMNADGTGKTNLTQSAAADYAPRWSPDSQKIVFYRNLGTATVADREIFSMNADGSGQTRLTNNSGQNWYPDWSPDGLQIMFHAYFNNYADLYVMNANGGGVTNVTNTQFQYASVQPDWQ